MDPARLALPGYFVTFFLLAGVLPSLRLRRRAGTTGYVAHRAPTPVHRVGVEGLRAVFLGIAAWVALYAAVGAEALGVWRRPAPVAALGWALMLLAFAGVALAQRQMGASWRVGIDARARTALVTHGLFGRVRNPIFSGMALAALGLVLVSPSAWTVAGWAFFAWVLALQVRLEEEHLLRLHGAAYAEYSARVGRFVPGVGRLPLLPQQPPLTQEGAAAPVASACTSR